MNFIEKDLEDIIYHNFEGVKNCGLEVGTRTHKLGLFRQVRLGRYGVADLIYVGLRRDRMQKILEVSIIECKLNQINTNAYLQAKRYLTAIECILEEFHIYTYQIITNTILIGQRLDTQSDFVYALNNDSNCEAFTYTYGLEGLKFKRVGKDFGLANGGTLGCVSEIKKSFPSLIRNCINTQPEYSDIF